MSTKISDQLHAVRDLIEDKTRWCVGWFAVDCDGNQVDEAASSAVSWCVIGACRKNNASVNVRNILQRVSRNIFDLYPDEVNDALGHAAVMQLLDAAIAEAESKSC